MAAEPGLQRAYVPGQPAWVISRYEDIRAALVDPRLCADTISDAIRPSGDDGDVP